MDRKSNKQRINLEENQLQNASRLSTTTNAPNSRNHVSLNQMTDSQNRSVDMATGNLSPTNKGNTIQNRGETQLTTGISMETTSFNRTITPQSTISQSGLNRMSQQPMKFQGQLNRTESEQKSLDQLKNKLLLMALMKEKQRKELMRPVSLDSPFLMPRMSGSITFTNLRVAPYDVIEILDIKIEHNINEHGTLYFKGILNEDQKDVYTLVASKGTNVVLSVLPEDHVLFNGMAKDVQVRREKGVYYIEVHAVSYSYLLDLKLDSVSYQDGGMTYDAIAQEIVGMFGGSVLDMASNGASINQFIMRFEETGWQFLKRLASHFNVGLSCDVRFNKPMIYFGMPHLKSLKLDNFNYTVKKDVARFKFLSKNGVSGLSENDFIYYEVETDQIVSIGDQVTFQDKALRVASIKSEIEQGIFISRLILAPLRGLSQPMRYNEKIAGCSFNGTINDIKNDQVKISLDIDGGKPGVRFFAYSTVYSSASGSGFYCMPEMGDTVRLYVPDSNEEHAYVISSVHEPVSPPPADAAGASSGASAGGVGGGIAPGGMRDDPDVKSFRSATGKEIRLTPEGIYIISEGAVIVLTEEDGIMIQSENDIEFHSQKNIIIAAEKDVNIIGTTGVELCAEAASLTLEENVNIMGHEVLSNGGA